jgi:hypothetical protein
MYPHSHGLFPLLVGLVLQKLGYVGYDWILVAVFVGVFVDIDHLLKHFYLSGELSIRGTWNSGIVKHEQDRTFIHHKKGILITGLLLLVGYAYWPYWASAVALGFFSHMFLDHYSLTSGFVDYMTDKKMWGYWKPVRLSLFGFIFTFSLHEIMLDVMMVVGLVVVLLV